MVEAAAVRPKARTVRTSLMGLLAFEGLPIGVAACLTVAGFGFANGGYFPVSWGWGSLALLLLAAVALLVGVPVELGVRDVLFLAALVSLTGWVALSLVWTSSVPPTVLELERMLVYLAVALACLLLIRRRDAVSVLMGVWIGLAILATYALSTRLFPDRLGTFDPVAGYRLSDPVGYWNALGILAGIGTLLALGLAVRGGPFTRSLAAGTTVIFTMTLYFTYSRAGWIALLAGLGVAIALDRERLRLVTTALVLAPWSAIAVAIASTSTALTHTTAGLAAAGHDGHGLALVAIGLVVAAALSIVALDRLRATVLIPRRLRTVYVGILLALLVALLIGGLVRYGAPQKLARNAYDSFVASRDEGADLNTRLFSLSGSGRSENWHTAWQEATNHPVLGGGAGSYAAYWFQHRRVDATVHDAHSLYLEALAELGPLGLALLLTAIAIPLAAIRRARRAPLSAVVAGAYVAFVLHAAVDWDWEVAAVTSTALLCGMVLIAAARGDGEPYALRATVRLAALAGVAALAGFATLTLLGNSAISASSKSTDGGHLARAQSQARRAADFVPWSSEPWRKLGEAQVLAGDLAAARTSFRQAIAKDRRDWTLWVELAEASSGADRTRALAEAERLNPLGEAPRPPRA